MMPPKLNIHPPKFDRVDETILKDMNDRVETDSTKFKKYVMENGNV